MIEGNFTDDGILDGGPIDSVGVGEIHVLKMPEYKWTLRMGGNVDGIHYQFVSAPNWFHRKMQKLILGFEWRRI